MAAKFPKTPIVVSAAHVRRVRAATERAVRIEWFIKEVSNKVTLTMAKRVRLATALLKNKILLNISCPVMKGVGPRGGRVVTGRSKPGEFPKAETAQLMRTLFSVVLRTTSGMYDGFVGTPLHYGLILETKMNRSFLVRTLNENIEAIRAVLAGPIK